MTFRKKCIHDYNRYISPPTMSPQVIQFDEEKAKAELKQCPKIVRDYFKLLQGHLERNKEITAKAVGKLVELSKSKATIPPPLAPEGESQEIRLHTLLGKANDRIAELEKEVSERFANKVMAAPIIASILAEREKEKDAEIERLTHRLRGEQMDFQRAYGEATAEIARLKALLLEKEADINISAYILQGRLKQGDVLCVDGRPEITIYRIDDDLVSYCHTNAGAYPSRKTINALANMLQIYDGKWSVVSLPSPPKPLEH